MQPIVGVIADRSKSKYGRRRPFMIIGSVIVAACLIILGWTKEMVGIFIGNKETAKTCSIAVAVLSIYALDFAVNAGKSKSSRLWFLGKLVGRTLMVCSSTILLSELDS